jgi:hypothetical protein
VIQAFLAAATAISRALAWRNNRRRAGVTRTEAFRTRMKVVFLALVVCSLCSKAVVHAYRHFNPPPPPIIGP